MKIAVITVTYNSGKVLPDFLASFAAQDATDLTLYVVDNESHDDTLALIDEARPMMSQRVVVIANDDNLGVAEANNQGTLAALADGADWIVYLNNDTMFAPDMLSALIDEAVEENLDILAPTIEATEPPRTVWYSGGRLYPWQALAVRHTDVGADPSHFPTALTMTQYASTCALAVRPRVLETIGLMDPIYFVYFDDVDFAVRARAAGFQFWVTPRSHVIHKASSLTGGKQSDFTIRWTSRNWVLLNRLNTRGMRRAYGLGYIWAWAIGRLVLRRDTWRTFKLRTSRYCEAMSLDLGSAARRTRLER